MTERVETLDEQLSRFDLMCEGSPTRDLNNAQMTKTPSNHEREWFPQWRREMVEERLDLLPNYSHCKHPAISHEEEFGNCDYLGQTDTGWSKCECPGLRRRTIGRISRHGSVRSRASKGFRENEGTRMKSIFAAVLMVASVGTWGQQPTTDNGYIHTHTDAITQAPFTSNAQTTTTPLKCGKYQHVWHWAGKCWPTPNQCDPDGFTCTAVAVCTPPPPDHCSDDMHEVTEREWQELMDIQRADDAVWMSQHEVNEALAAEVKALRLAVIAMQKKDRSVEGQKVVL